MTPTLAGAVENGAGARSSLTVTGGAAAGGGEEEHER